VKTRGRYSYDATLERVRSACSKHSTIDVEQQAQLVARDVIAKREQAHAEIVEHALRRARR
jgi:hypothetical protein